MSTFDDLFSISLKLQHETSTLGSLMLDSDDVAAFANDGNPRLIKNSTSICANSNMVNFSNGVFTGSNPLEFSVPLLLLQLAISSGVIALCSRILKHFGQPLIVSQILGGIILGSSVLGQISGYRKWIFPLRGYVLLDIFSSMGFMFHFFLLGLQIDIWIIKKIDRRSFIIGFSSVALPMILTMISNRGFMWRVDPNLAKSLPLVGKADSIFSLPMVAYLLSELNVINSELGRVALSTSVAGGLCGFSVVAIAVLFTETNGDKFIVLNTIVTTVMISCFIIFLFRPVVLWMIKKNPVGQPLKEGYVITLLVGILLCGFCSQAAGLFHYLGPFMLGVTIPVGPPVGTALIERLDFITTWIFMPIFFVKVGFVINVFMIKLKNFLILTLLALIGAFGKFLGAFLTSLYCRLPLRDAISLGLVLNSQGSLEIGLLKHMKKHHMIDTETFISMIIFILFIVATITPIIRYLYDPSRKYAVYKRRTVMHTRPNSVLRVLVCIHDQDDVPIAINLLEALNPTRRSHLVVYALHLIELFGRANPLLITHKLSKIQSSKASPSECIVNAFRYFGQNNLDCTSVYPYTAISPSEAMHDDVCTLSLDKRTSLILLPFHKRFHSSGVIASCKPRIRAVNNNVLDKAPCSVAMIVDRGLLKGSRCITSNWSSFHVAVVFLGGADDREAMFIGGRMAGHHNINLTMIRLLENENVTTSDGIEERRLDEEAVTEFQRNTEGNCRVVYIEEVAIDGMGTVSVLRSMGDNFELVIVGRRHSVSSPLVQGLVLWHEQTELGAIGEVLASSEFMGNALIMVVQQHTNVLNGAKHDPQDNTVINGRHFDDDDDDGGEDVDDFLIQGRV